MPRPSVIASWGFHRSRGTMSVGAPPRSDQSRTASSISVFDLLIHTARVRPASQPARITPATWRPLPVPVPSPRK